VTESRLSVLSRAVLVICAGAVAIASVLGLSIQEATAQSQAPAATLPEATPPEATPPDQRRETGLLGESDVTAIAEILELRAAAVLAGDEAAHLATIAAAATDRFREIEARTVDGAATIGFDAFSESIDLPAIDLAPPGLAGPVGEQVVVLSVTRRLQFTQVDAWPTAVTLYLSFIDTPDGWRVLGDNDLAVIGLASGRALWELRSGNVLRTDRVVAIGTVGIERLDQVAELTETAIDRFETNWGQPWQGSVVVIVPTGLAEVEELLRPTGDASRFVAFTTLDVDRSAGWEVVSPRIVTQESNMARRSVERQIEVLVHELVHVASVRASGPATPLWFHEGLADWITAGRPAVTDEEVEFPDLYLFRTGSVSEIAAVYDQAERTMAQLAGQFGAAVPWQLFVEVGEARSEPGSSDYLVAKAIETITGSAP